jgi:hypothetical protein
MGKYPFTLIDCPIEGFCYLHNLTFDGTYFGGVFLLPLTKYQTRVLNSIRNLVPSRRRRLDNIIKLSTSKMIGSKPFSSFEYIIKFCKDNLVFFTPQMLLYLNIAMYGEDRSFDLNFSREERFEAIRMWVKNSSHIRTINNENRRYLIKVEGIYQTFRTFTEIVFRRVPDRIAKFLRNRLPRLIYEDPIQCIEYAKKFAQYCEQRFFDKDLPIPSDNPFSVYVQFLDERGFAWGRYITRSLPHGKPPTLEDYINRVSDPGEPDDEIIDEFRRFIREWAIKRMPKDLPPARFNPSNNASLETTRASGGQSSIYESLIQFQIIRLHLKMESDADKWCLTDEYLKFVFSPDFFNDYISESNVSSVRFNVIKGEDEYEFFNFEGEKGVVTNTFLMGSVRFKLLVAACWNLMNEFPRNPITVLILEERGGKFRIPTKCLVIVQILGQLLRDRIDFLMKRDKNIVKSYTGQDPEIIELKLGELYRSLDLSKATDMYSFRIIRTMYTELLDVGLFNDLPFARQFLEWMFPEDAGRDIMKPLTVQTAIRFPKVPKVKSLDAFWEKFYNSQGPGVVKEKIPLVNSKLSKDYWYFVSDGSGYSHSVLETREGRPISYNQNKLFKSCGINRENLPLVERDIRLITPIGDINERGLLKEYLVKFVKTYVDFIHKNYEVVGIQRRGPCMGEPLSWPILPLATKFCLVETHHHSRLETYGDDAIFATRPILSDKFDKKLSRLGGVVNREKDVIHPSKYLFTERLYKDGKPYGVMPFAPAAAMPSLKQEQTYLTVGSSLDDLRVKHRVPYNSYQKILRSSRFREEVNLYSKLVLPPDLSTDLGGLKYDLAWSNKDWTKIRKLASFVENFSINELISSKSLNFSRDVKQPVKLNRDFYEKLLNPQPPMYDMTSEWDELPSINIDRERELTNWRFKDAWSLKSQSIYGLASLTGSAPLSMDTKRPTILSRKVRIGNILSKERSKTGDINLKELSLVMKEKLNPLLFDFFPDPADQYPLVVSGDTFWYTRNNVFKIRDPKIVQGYRELDNQGNSA